VILAKRFFIIKEIEKKHHAKNTSSAQTQQTNLPKPKIRSKDKEGRDKNKT
jgi:hypothetical protein